VSASSKHPKYVWRYDAKRLVLAYYNEDGEEWYEIDLEKCRTSAKTLDWIAQVGSKLWATDEVLGGLVRALNCVFNTLQGKLCGSGREHGPIDVKALLRGTQSYDFPIGEWPGWEEAFCWGDTSEEDPSSAVLGVPRLRIRTAAQVLNDPLPDPIRPRAPGKVQPRP
jgi:hypothetical protein